MSYTTKRLSPYELRQRQEAESRRLDQAELDRQAEIDGKLTTFDKEVAAPLAAKAAAAKVEQQAKEDALLKEQAAAFDRRYKAPALATWRATGGTEATFNQDIWPGMREKLQTDVATNTAHVAQREYERRARSRYK